MKPKDTWKDTIRKIYEQIGKNVSICTYVRILKIITANIKLEREHKHI